MSVFVVKNPGKLPGIMIREQKRSKRAFLRGLRRGAKQGKIHLLDKSKRLGIDHTGQFRNSWDIKKRADGGVDLVNDAPHAGIVELGARPHKMGREGIEAIREWVRIKVWGLTGSRGLQVAAENSFVDEMTWGIVKKIEEEGQEGTLLVQSSLITLRRIVKNEVERALREMSSKPPGGTR